MRSRDSREPRARSLSPLPFGLSLMTAFPRPFHSRTASDSSSVSPLSSATASPTSFPTSRARIRADLSCHLLSSRPAATADDDYDEYDDNDIDSQGRSRSRSRSPSPSSKLYITLYSRYWSPVLFRRHPSAADLALIEERSRCNEDAVERQGLSLMEPRPVEPFACMRIDPIANVRERAGKRPDRTRTTGSSLSMRSSQLHQPRFVMGGIFEVMEGRA